MDLKIACSVVGTISGWTDYDAMVSTLDADPRLERVQVSDYSQFALAWDIRGGDCLGNLDQSADRIVAVRCRRGSSAP